jgi:putative hydrolase of the HAD superfamily
VNQLTASIELNHNPDVSRRFVIFDMFDTLVKLRSDIGKYEIIEVLHSMYLLEYDFERVRVLYDEVVDRLISERRKDDLEIVFVEIMEHIFNGLGISGYDLAEIEDKVFHGSDFVSHMPGAKDTLEFFKRNGYKVAVLSNSYFLESTLVRCFKNLGLYDLIDEVVSSADILYMKPRKEAYDAVLERVGAEASDAFFAGDNPVNDYDGPKSHGMTPIHVHLKGDTREVSVRSIGDIPSLFAANE